MRAAAIRTATTLASLLVLGLLLASPATAAEEFDKYALESVGAELSTNQAGAHADMTISFRLTEEKGKPFARTRDVFIELPPGVIGNPQNFPRCSISQLGETPPESECPQDSQVGVVEITLNELGTMTQPIYNMYSPGGEIVARLGFYAGIYPAIINIRVNPEDYSLIAAVEGSPSAAEVISAKTTLWGVPAADVHDELRLTPAEAAQKEFPVGGRPSGQPEIPFLSNPTDCSLQRTLSITAVSYQLPSKPSTLSAPFPQITGCEKLNFKPKFTATPTNPEAFAPTGLDATLTIPQSEAPNDLATSTLKSAVVSLPPGMSINPAAGEGLAACSPAELRLGTNLNAACPEAAKIGSVEVDVPALERTLQGSVYQRTPEDGKLFRFWVVTDEQGVHLKLPAEIQANPLTGQVTTVFSGISSLGGLPQVPFSELRLHVFGGPRAPLATPGCGTHQTSYAFFPWSGKPPASGNTAMQITSGCGKGGFKPWFEAGSMGSAAGAFSPFTMTLTRQDGEANPSSFSVHLPRGLLAKLGGVPLCSDAAAATASCPSGSQIGTLAAAAGVGGAPLWIPQPGKEPTAIYLAGPYKGAPYSLVAKVPAQAGPFDLGTVVNRSGIYVDPTDATATIKTDPLPQILQGVPIAYRALHVTTNRPNFTLNPTGCKPKQITATVGASNGASATVSDAYQATNCAKLPYKPKLKLTFKGSTKRTGIPAVKAVLTQKPGQANTAGASVILPSSMFIEQSHIGNPCTRPQFEAEACPKKALLGHATAKTPLLDEPLKGSVWFRSNGGARELPDVVVDLRGPFRVILVGFVDSVGKKGSEVARIRTRFQNVPDAPVSRFELNLFGGKRGLLVNSKNLCKTDRRAQVALTAQNGRVQKTNQRIATGCGGKR
jgi:hypothetical protein